MLVSSDIFLVVLNFYHDAHPEFILNLIRENIQGSNEVLKSKVMYSKEPESLELL